MRGSPYLLLSRRLYLQLYLPLGTLFRAPPLYRTNQALLESQFSLQRRGRPPLSGFIGQTKRVSCCFWIVGDEFASCCVLKQASEVVTGGPHETCML